MYIHVFKQHLSVYCQYTAAKCHETVAGTTSTISEHTETRLEYPETMFTFHFSSGIVVNQPNHGPGVNVEEGAFWAAQRIDSPTKQF